MSRRLVQIDSRTYSISPDDQPPLGLRRWALVQGRVVDELTGRPPVTPITLDSDAHSTTAHLSSAGLVGLVGVPRDVWPALALKNFAIRLSIRAERYVPRQVTVAIADDQRTIAPPAPPLNATVVTLDTTSRLSAGETLLLGHAGPQMAMVRILALGPGPNQVTVAPGLTSLYAVGDPVVPIVQDDFSPTAAGDLALHRQPTVITGRVVQVTGSARTPVSGATIQVTGIWPTPPPADMVVAPDPPNIVSLQPPLYFDREAATGDLNLSNLQPLPGEDKSLLDDVLEGTDLIRLSNSQNLAAGDIILIDAGSRDLAEYIAISAMVSGSSTTQPATVTLSCPLACRHRSKALVQKVSPQPSGAQIPVARDALAGDAGVFLDTVAGLTAGSQVRVAGGPNPDEYHELRLFSAASDADGYYRLPPLSRVAQLSVRAEKAPLTPIEVELRPDYDLFENRLDFIFR